jgi:hypothetical protein
MCVSPLTNNRLAEDMMSEPSYGLTGEEDIRLCTMGTVIFSNSCFG